MSEKTYEMLWDCGFCGATKWLGKSHRHCPSCGAPQDADARYFPEDDADRVAVEDHEFVGADWKCGACERPNATVAEFCGSCGSPKDGNAQVNLQSDSPPQAPAAPAEEPESSTPWKLIGLAVAVLAVGFLAVFFLWTEQKGVEVVSHSWERSIEIEEYKTVQDGAWKEQVPRKAYNLQCAQKEKSKKKVEDGQDCKMVKQDKGDGTFTEREECTTRYKEVPVYGEYCRYSIEKWVVTSTPTTQSNDLEPAWPIIQIEECAIESRGCKRTGARRATYTVGLADDDGEKHACEYEEDKWSSMQDGSRWTAEFRKVGGSIACDSLMAL
ncbi:MAG: zinc ribbon domain-containing protein [Myxococcota bacterium]|nr:zinc ribbon domain-containing protein [Myxococcota bacterium]